MMLPSLQIKLIFMLTIFYAETKKPPGYVEPPKVPDPNPPKYEYGYNIADEKGDGQGKQEQRDGIYALGRYYVQGKESRQNVQYFADDWGYHPVVEYGSVGPHSRTTAHFAFGEEAVKQLKNKENNRPQLQGILEDASKFNQPNAATQSPIQHQSPSAEQPQQIILQQPLQEEQQFLSQPQQNQAQPQQELDVRPQHQHTEGKSEQLPLAQQPQEIEQQSIQPEVLQAQLENQSQPQYLENQQQQDQPQEQPQQLHLFPQQQLNIQPDSPETNQGEQAQPQLLYQQYQPQHQIYLQQPKSQQQVIIHHEPQQQTPIEETSQNNIAPHEQEQPQQVILRHEEPSQKLIFPQETQEGYEQFPQESYLKEHPKDNIIFKTEGVNPQLVYVQDQPEQQHFVQPIYQNQQAQVQTNIIHTQGHLQDQQQVNVETKQYETAALYDNSNNKLIIPQQLVQSNTENKHYDDSSISVQNLGSYGSKINVVQEPVDTSNKLIEHTKNLVTGQDVLNINEAISKNYNANVESNTPHSDITDFVKSHLLSGNANVNEAVTKNYNANVESSTPHSVITEFVTSHLLSGETYANVEINQSNNGYSTTTISPATEASLNAQPIVVAELEENTAKSTSENIQVSQNSQQEYSSTTITNLENVSSEGIEMTSPSTVLVTPRPVSTSFLAPITAGIQLQNIEQHAEERVISSNQNYKVEIQKSLPYYLGKYEYPSSYGEHVSVNNVSSQESNAEIKATENIELGKTLLFFPSQGLPKTELQRPPKVVIKQPFTTLNNHISIQHAPSTIVKEKFVEYDQQPAQGYQHQVVFQQVGLGVSGHVTQKPTEITKIIREPYPVKVPYEVPYPVVKQVQVPVTVQRIVEKPVHITKYIEKPVAVPQPYPVEKIVEKPIHVPVQVTKYIDRPYPVEVRVPYLQPYPVEKVVQRIVKQPYPVEVRVPVHVEKIVEKKVPVPHYIEKPVEKIVEKPVAHYVDRPYPVEVKVPVPQPYLVRVEVPKPYPVEVNKFQQNPYPTQQISHLQTYQIPQTVNYQHAVQVGAPLHIYSQTGYSSNKQEQHAQQSQQQTFFYANPYAYAPQINQYLPPKQEIILNNGYLPAKQGNYNYLPPKKDCDQQKQAQSISNYYYSIKPDDYIGLLPPKVDNNQIKYVRKLRTARSNFDDKSVRMEYGFLPPLVPSLEIDEQGNPIDKGEK